MQKYVKGSCEEVFAPDKPIEPRQTGEFLDFDRHNLFFGAESRYISELEWRTMTYLVNNLVSKQISTFKIFAKFLGTYSATDNEPV